MHVQDQSARDQADLLAGLKQKLAERESGLADASAQLKQAAPVKALRHAVCRAFRAFKARSTGGVLA